MVDDVVKQSIHMMDTTFGSTLPQPSNFQSLVGLLGRDERFRDDDQMEISTIAWFQSVRPNQANYMAEKAQES
jgi:hypothetical protein